MVMSMSSVKAGGRRCSWDHKIVSWYAINKTRGCTMQKLLVFACLVVLLFGCGQDEPSLSDIENGCKESLSREMGIPPSAILTRAHKIGGGRWSVRVTLIRLDGQSRSMGATAVLDENGDVHYYSD